MPITVIVQDLVTVSLDPAGTAREVIQDEAAWPDLGPYQDVVMLTYISQQGGSSSGGSLNLEVSPLKEDAIFRVFSLPISARAAPTGWTNQANVHMTSGTSFHHRYMRWRLVGPTTGGTATWTFRLVLSVNPALRGG
jgi:hypothetical protein